ncbi:hypothetical protein, partial [Xanthomonas dyei]|uniref:hypothetical protein n=2 Tax=Xanthomonas dyei TaxID=743699 RepID=UPI001B80355A
WRNSEDPNAILRNDADILPSQASLFRPSLALRASLLESRQAHAGVQACKQRVDAVASWKQRAEHGRLQLHTYQLALDAEGVVYAEQTHAQLRADACDGRLDDARTMHRDTSAEERSVDERYRRLSEHIRHGEERTESDVSAELWLARRVCDGH